MSHRCTALLLRCIDFRFDEAITDYLKNRGLRGDCDVVSVAGAAKNLAAPAEPSDAEFVMRQIDISKRLHNIGEVFLVNHTDCGAYGGRPSFESRTDENARHTQDLHNASSMIKRKYPDLAVHPVLAQIEPDGAIRFEELY